MHNMSLGAMQVSDWSGGSVCYISPPVNQKVCAKKSIFHREKSWENGVLVPFAE